MDYDPKAEVSVQFFKRVQNKIHYAVSGETAAEVIYHRADAEKDFMGLMTFSGDQPTLRESKIAKNYLDEKELRAMGQLVSGYLDFAERQAEREIPMTMEDWTKHLDGILTSRVKIFSPEMARSATCRRWKRLRQSIKNIKQRPLAEWKRTIWIA